MPSLLLAGGMISFDVFPEGWDKRYCLNVLDDERFDAIHFFGNETTPVSMPRSPYTRLLSLLRAGKPGWSCSITGPVARVPPVADRPPAARGGEMLMRVCVGLVVVAGLLGGRDIALNSLGWGAGPPWHRLPPPTASGWGAATPAAHRTQNTSPPALRRRLFNSRNIFVFPLAWWRVMLPCCSFQSSAP